MDLALALGSDLLLLDDGGAIAGPPVDDDDSGFFNSANAELLGRLGFTGDPAPSRAFGELESKGAADPRAGPAARWACDRDGLPKNHWPVRRHRVEFGIAALSGNIQCDPSPYPSSV